MDSYLSMPIGLGLLVLQYVAELLCLVTGRAPPFGIEPSEDAEHVAQEQAKRRWETPHESHHRRRVVLVATLMMLLSGMPVAFGLGAVSIVFLLLFQGIDSMHVVAETF